jgi:hypothetical protein
MQADLECEGKVVVGPLPTSMQKKLADFRGNWLEYSPKEKAIVVCHVQPIGCPALSAVPCELMALLGTLTPEQREAVPGGTFYLKNKSGPALRIAVEGGEIRLQWPHPDYARAAGEKPEKLFAALNPSEAKVRGWARFGGGKKEVSALQAALDRFEGLYEEGDIVPSLKSKTVSVEFKDVNIGPKELVAKLRELAKPPGSLEAELDVSSFVPDSDAADFRIRISRGKIETVRPSLWR